MFGFFKPEELERFDKRNITYSRSSYLACYSCGLERHAQTPRMGAWGKNRKKFLIIGEAPGRVEDEKGMPWQGKSGKRLQSELKRFNIDIEQDCLSFNAVNCRPPDNRTPTEREISYCRSTIVQPTLSDNEAHVILLLGSSAVNSVISASEEFGHSISLWRGWAIPDQKRKAWICPTFHPSYVERSEDDDLEQVTTIWRQDIEQAIDLLNTRVPDYSDYRKYVRLLQNEDEIESVLRRILRREEGDFCAFDYETTGLKPYDKGHNIVCVSVCTEEASYAFMDPQRPRIINLWHRFLRSPNIPKVSHNIKFEDTWSAVLLKTETRNWKWDTMLAAHVLDNRPGITGLKFQTYINFGIFGYDSYINPYLKSLDSKNSNSKNNIYQAIRDLGEDQVLTYCALDSLFTRWLALKQMRELGAI